MIEKRILIIEDILQLKFMEDLFRRSLNGEKYELRTLPDLSDEGFYRGDLPEDYDVYWLHSSAIEFGVIEQVRRNQPWSKVVVRSGVAESIYAYNLLMRNVADVVISHNEGLNEGKIIQILNGLGIEILLPEKECSKK